MLKISTYIADSRIPNAGIGLFAGELARKGQVVCDKRNGTYQIFSDEEYKRFPPDFQNFVKTYAYHVQGEWRLDKDNEKYINHCRSPNLSPSGIAIKDILPGEELTYDYRQIDDLISNNSPEWI